MKLQVPKHQLGGWLLTGRSDGQDTLFLWNEKTFNFEAVPQIPGTDGAKLFCGLCAMPCIDS